MTLRAFRKRPPFPFVNRARDDLPCLPCVNTRGTHPTYYGEFYMMLGPQAIGDTRDNTLPDLIGREWAFLFCDNNDWYLLQWVDTEHLNEAPGLTSPGWALIDEPLLTLPNDLACGTQRRFSAAFDQAARLVVAYEQAETILVTRWDTTLGAYLQNVNFSGVDPVLVFDATWSWQVPGSDVVLFYLTTDRTKLMARAQRDVYAVEYELWDFGHAAVLDRVTRLPLRYQALASDGVGAPLVTSGARTGLLSNLYPYPARERAFLTGAAGDGEISRAAWRPTRTDRVSLAALGLDGEYAEATIRYESVQPGAALTALAGDGLTSIALWRRSQVESPVSVTALAGDGLTSSANIRYAHQQYDVNVALSALALDGALEEDS